MRAQLFFFNGNILSVLPFLFPSRFQLWSAIPQIGKHLSNSYRLSTLFILNAEFLTS